MATKVIYFTVDGSCEQAEFRSDDPADDIKGKRSFETSTFANITQHDREQSVCITLKNR